MECMHCLRESLAITLCFGASRPRRERRRCPVKLYERNTNIDVQPTGRYAALAGKDDGRSCVKSFARVPSLRLPTCLFPAKTPCAIRKIFTSSAPGDLNVPGVESDDW